MNAIRKLNHCVYIIGTAQNLQTLFFLDYYGYSTPVYYIIWKIRKYCSINAKFKAHVVTLWDLPPSRPP